MHSCLMQEISLLILLKHIQLIRNVASQVGYTVRVGLINLNSKFKDCAIATEHGQMLQDSDVLDNLQYINNIPSM